jgi:hypothetical protein
VARVSSKYTCTACEAKISREEVACTQCGHPTDHATMEQRVLWELGRWQDSREAPIVARDPSESRTPVRPAAVAPPASMASGPRSSGSTAPAYDFHPDAQPARPEPPQLVRPHPIERPEPAPAPRSNGGKPPAELLSRRSVPLSVAPVAEAKPAIVEEATEGRRARKAREKAAEKQRAQEQRHAETLERENARTRAAQEREEQRRAAAAEPSRSDRRQARKYRHLTDGITLHEGETITLTMGGWSRGRPAVLVVTRYRVALITKLPNSLHWIPLEEVSQMSLHWRGGWTLEIEGSVEFLSLHKRKKQTLIALKELLASEVAESRAPGGRRHHPEVTQDWCDRSIEMWETHAGQIRLFIRRHPALVVATLAIWVPVAYYFALR